MNSPFLSCSWAPGTRGTHGRTDQPISNFSLGPTYFVPVSDGQTSLSNFQRQLPLESLHSPTWDSQIPSPFPIFCGQPSPLLLSRTGGQTACFLSSGFHLRARQVVRSRERKPGGLDLPWPSVGLTETQPGACRAWVLGDTPPTSVLPPEGDPWGQNNLGSGALLLLLEGAQEGTPSVL